MRYLYTLSQNKALGVWSVAAYIDVTRKRILESISSYSNNTYKDSSISGNRDNSKLYRLMP